MIPWFRRGLAPRHLAAALLFGGLGALGCGQKSSPETPAPREEQKPAVSRKVDPDPEPAVRGAAVVKPEAAVVRDRLHQAFADATLGPDSPPADSVPPVDQTMTGRSAPVLFDQVVKAWDGVRFTTADGKKIDYVAELSTSHGVIRMALLPELAPNHCRNFIVLARLGYYDGLRFDRIHHEQAEGGGVLKCVEAGCPLGTGEAGTGSLGYWVKDEFTPGEKMSHTEGVVGACRSVEPDTAATKFYINLNTAPFRDGHYSLFAKVVAGLDVARIIGQQPVTTDPEDESRARPSKPIVIHKVTIQETIAEADKK